MEPTLRQVSELNISGLGIRTCNSDEISPFTAKIPKLWERFLDENFPGKIRNSAKPNIAYGVYTNYESDGNGEYNILAGIEVSSFQGNAEMKNLSVPGGNYLMFSGKGKMPEIVLNTWKEVWNYFSSGSKYKRAFKTDFEKYVSNEEVEIYISVK